MSAIPMLWAHSFDLAWEKGLDDLEIEYVALTAWFHLVTQAVNLP